MTSLHTGLNRRRVSGKCDMSSRMRVDRPSFLRAGFISLRTSPCSWNKCIFCGFFQECVSHVPTVEEMVEQVRYGLGRFQNVRDSWCVLNKGSFFDDRQVPEEHRLALARCLNEEGVKNVFIESRPEFVAEERLHRFRNELGNQGGLTVGLGLETSNEMILDFIKKGLSLNSFEKCVELLHQHGATAQTFLMAGLPGATEPESTLESVQFAKRVGSDQIMISATVPRRGTELRRMWERGEWQPIDITLFSQIIEFTRTIFEPEDVDVWLCGVYNYQSKAQRERYRRYGHRSTRDQARIEDFYS